MGLIRDVKLISDGTRGMNKANDRHNETFWKFESHEQERNVFLIQNMEIGGYSVENKKSFAFF